MVPLAHRVTILDVTPAEGAALVAGVQRAMAAIVGAYDPEGVAVWQNNGVPAHQTVPHVHVHVAGTRPGGGTEWGAVPRLAVTATDAIADRLRPHLAAYPSSPATRS